MEGRGRKMRQKNEVKKLDGKIRRKDEMKNEMKKLAEEGPAYTWYTQLSRNSEKKGAYVNKEEEEQLAPTLY